MSEQHLLPTAYDLPLIVIVGPTASGKTAAAIEIAQRHSGEIICADSRTIYKGMDIGTAKPSLQEQMEVPHHGLDLVDPDERFTVADFKDYATKKISEIRARGNTPILVGGTGLYVDSVVFNFHFNNKADTTWRGTPTPNTIIVGIATNRTVLRGRIEERAEQLFVNGVVEEATSLGKKYGWELPSMSGNIYPLIHEYLNGAATELETKQRFMTLDWQLAKRQMTWLRPNPYIQWCTRDEVVSVVERLIVTE